MKRHQLQIRLQCRIIPENMFTKSTLEKIKQNVVILTFGMVLSIVPFYFQTKAMTEDHQEKITEQIEALKKQEERLKELEVQGAIDDTEIKQINERLERIEKKIDRLIERDK